ncbi:hypothetical protein ABK040_012405 [Willaertia magna]
MSQQPFKFNFNFNENSENNLFMNQQKNNTPFQFNFNNNFTFTSNNQLFNTNSSNSSFNKNENNVDNNLQIVKFNFTSFKQDTNNLLNNTTSSSTIDNKNFENIYNQKEIKQELFIAGTLGNKTYNSFQPLNINIPFKITQIANLTDHKILIVVGEDGNIYTLNEDNLTFKKCDNISNVKLLATYNGIIVLNNKNEIYRAYEDLIFKKVIYFNEKNENIIKLKSGYCCFIILTDKNNIYVHGKNDHGQLGIKEERTDEFIKIENIKDEIIDIENSKSTTLLLTKVGDLYMSGVCLDKNGKEEVLYTFTKFKSSFFEQPHIMQAIVAGEYYKFYRFLNNYFNNFFNNYLSLFKRISNTNKRHLLVLNEKNELFVIGNNFANKLGLNLTKLKYTNTFKKVHNFKLPFKFNYLIADYDCSVILSSEYPVNDDDMMESERKDLILRKKYLMQSILGNNMDVVLKFNK